MTVTRPLLLGDVLDDRLNTLAHDGPLARVDDNLGWCQTIRR